jgi:hypothetical protein
MSYQQLEKVLMRAAFDQEFRLKLVKAGTSAKSSFSLDPYEGQVLDLLLNDNAGALAAVLNVIHASGEISRTTGLVAKVERLTVDMQGFGRPLGTHK